jgi:hypothetical protein
MESAFAASFTETAIGCINFSTVVDGFHSRAKRWSLKGTGEKMYSSGHRGVQMSGDV